MIGASLPAVPSFEDWRRASRNLLAVAAAPETVVWRVQGETDLFASADASNPALTGDVSVPRAFVELAEAAVLHRDPARFALLYRILWRLQIDKRLMEDAADPDIVRLHALARAVRRDEHKMHAFVRFKEIETADGPRFVAWFEPQHHILERVTGFFIRRFAGMTWSIITPDASAHWNGDKLRIGPGGVRSDVPEEDARDDDWRAYYESMFNPARLKIAAMKREMPRQYWRNLPEAERIPDLIKGAFARTEHMVAATPSQPRKRAGAAHAGIKPKPLPARLEPIAAHEKPPASFEDLERALKACRACPLWREATQAVPGEGANHEPLLALVGEQPGDQEDLAGHPFVGPAGKVLDRALEAAAIDRGEVFVTNAVKHFKHEPRGKRRLHKRPNAGEIEICRWWLAHELKLARPKLVVALGATALQSLSTYRGALGAARAQTLKTREGVALRATVHPSYLLRLPDEAARQEQFDRFVTDLKKARSLANRLARI